MKNKKYIDKKTGYIIIGRRVLSITYQDPIKSKDEGFEKDDIWEHKFKINDVYIYGLPDGSVLLKSKSGKRLWGYR